MLLKEDACWDNILNCNGSNYWPYAIFGAHIPDRGCSIPKVWSLMFFLITGKTIYRDLLSNLQASTRCLWLSIRALSFISVYYVQGEIAPPGYPYIIKEESYIMYITGIKPFKTLHIYHHIFFDLRKNRYACIMLMV